MRVVRAVAVAMVLTLGVVACGSSKKTDAPSATTAPEGLRTSAAAVAAGLTQIEALAAQIAEQAGTDKAAAQEADAKIEPIWSSIEGTVKANDAEAYINFEDAFSALETAAESGDAAKAADGSSRVTATATAYLQSFPG